jgi:hypothetical protein
MAGMASPFVVFPIYLEPSSCASPGQSLQEIQRVQWLATVNLPQTSRYIVADRSVGKQLRSIPGNH